MQTGTIPFFYNIHFVTISSKILNTHNQIGIAISLSYSIIEL